MGVLGGQSIETDASPLPAGCTARISVLAPTDLGLSRKILAIYNF